MDIHRIAARMGTALPSLVRWGLSPDADLVYRTLVSLDTAREGQLAQELGMAHERVREAMRELANAGAIRRVSATSRRAPKANGRVVWAARQPNQVVRQLHVHRTRPVGAPTRVDSAPPPSDATPATTGADAAMQAGPGAPGTLTGAGHPASGGHAVANQPARADTTVTAPDGSGNTGRWIPQQVSGQHAEGLAGPGQQESIVLTPRERAIVELLAQGHTDETAARELELSRRTVGYALGGLMSRLGVDNRFQLGLALGSMRAAIPSPRNKAEQGGN